MARLEYFVVCRSIQTDVNTDEISLINVLEDITPESFPHIIQRAVAVGLWNFDEDDAPHDFQALLVVRIPGRPDFPVAMNLTAGARRRCRGIQGILGIPIDSPCEVTFEVSLNGQSAATHTVRVHPVETRGASDEVERMPRA